jgi:hypothetical protein
MNEKRLLALSQAQSLDEWMIVGPCKPTILFQFQLHALLTWPLGLNAAEDLVLFVAIGSSRALLSRL